MQYRSPGSDRRSDVIGVLVSNLGTPDAPTSSALRRYLRQFLSDPRVIEIPRWKWQIILNLFVLPFRPRRSAKAYQTVWTEQGSPLRQISGEQCCALQGHLDKQLETPVQVQLAMRYGTPSFADAIDALLEKGCRKILHLPLYPQYSGSTTGSNFDGLAQVLMRRRWVPELRTVNGYATDAGYVAALAASLEEAWADGGKPARLLFSFHGLPQRYVTAGDPYQSECLQTAQAVVARLGLDESEYAVAFQSRFGREPWLQPYTDETLEAWGREKVESVDVICPGFAADCLETLEEIDAEYREVFTENGGGRFRYIPALNARADHVDTIASIAIRNLQGWV
ncbi:MAG: ferrochelatase [Planctomycetota bacterium]